MSEAAWNIVWSWLFGSTLCRKEEEEEEEEKRSHPHGAGSMPLYGSTMICQAGWVDLICWMREVAEILDV